PRCRQSKREIGMRLARLRDHAGTELHADPERWFERGEQVADAASEVERAGALGEEDREMAQTPRGEEGGAREPFPALGRARVGEAADVLLARQHLAVAAICARVCRHPARICDLSHMTQFNLLTRYPPSLQLHGGLGSAGLAGTNPGAQRTAHDLLLVNLLAISCPGKRRASDARSHLLWPRLIRKEHKDLASTSPLRVTLRSLSCPRGQAAGRGASNGTTLQSTAAASIWRSTPNASTAASQTNKSSSTKSLPRSTTAMPSTSRQTGTSPPQRKHQTQASICPSM